MFYWAELQEVKNQLEMETDLPSSISDDLFAFPKSILLSQMQMFFDSAMADSHLVLSPPSLNIHEHAFLRSRCNSKIGKFLFT